MTKTTTKDLDIGQLEMVRELISRALETLRDTQGDTPDDCALVGKALGLLEAVEMMLRE